MSCPYNCDSFVDVDSRCTECNTLRVKSPTDLQVRALHARWFEHDGMRIIANTALDDRNPGHAALARARCAEVLKAEIALGC